MKNGKKKEKRKERPLENSPVVRGFLEYSNALKEQAEAVSPLQREMIYTVVSRQNGCVYCTIGHGRKFFELSGDKKLYEDIVRDYRQAAIDGRDRAMLDYVSQLNQKPETISREQLVVLHSAGFSREAILEIVTHAAVMSAQNRIRLGLGYELSSGIQREAARLGIFSEKASAESA